ncbi:MAG: hypothetical protein LBI99_07085 [Propionibacteriaceae bacterium]|jgi:hypothetical protein|nr:hypothetical protein [Propionibacteriaceae bacterium]
MTEILAPRRRESYLDGVEYEAVRNSVNNEIGYHANWALAAGYDSDLGKRHLQAVADLSDLRNGLDPDNPAAMEAVVLLLRSNRVGRPEPPRASALNESGRG